MPKSKERRLLGLFSSQDILHFEQRLNCGLPPHRAERHSLSGQCPNLECDDLSSLSPAAARRREAVFDNLLRQVAATKAPTGRRTPNSGTTLRAVRRQAAVARSPFSVCPNLP